MKFDDMVEGMEKSDNFLALVTPAYLRDPAALCQLGLAVVLGKRVLLAVEKGVDLSYPFWSLADHVIYFEGVEDISEAVGDLLKGVERGRAK